MLQKDVDIRQAEEIVKGIGIPVQSTIVNNLYREIKQTTPDIRKIVSLTSKDVGLSASILKIANSSFFGGGGISSIDYALNIVGLTSFFNIVVSSIFLNTYKEITDKHIFAKFWNHSMFVAKTMSLIAKQTKNIDENDAYITGLFHDCAIPLFLKKYSDYNTAPALGNDADITGKEDEKYQTNHCMAGFILTTSWRMPDVVSRVISSHHTMDILSHKKLYVRKVASCAFLAEHLVINYGGLQDGATSEVQGKIASGSESLEDMVRDNPGWEPLFTELGIAGADLAYIRRELQDTPETSDV
ncbi:HDOD domain-containing protein [Candidatus Magnetomonas plexicatena]|uniref:HDOD domain-containing protein n=1 Tax=Candidatus Magnetomonas plexicatena TaxID=2552947 RepID=UPI001C745BFB|nr:HDOD domain-containing protein [Nitrospirales bacterium LBB_01]